MTNSLDIIDRPFARIDGKSARRMEPSALPPEEILGRRGGRESFGVDQTRTKSSSER